MFKQTIIKAFLSWIFFVLWILVCIISIKAFENWSNIPTVDTTTPLSKDLWNTTMNTLTWNIQNLENRLDNLFTPITAWTATKVTYNSNGLVTWWSNLVEADIPNLSAWKITSWVLPPARLWTWTPTSSLFLRWDGAWSAVSVSWTSACSWGAHMTVLFNRNCYCGWYELKQCRNWTWATISVWCSNSC